MEFRYKMFFMFIFVLKSNKKPQQADIVVAFSYCRDGIVSEESAGSPWAGRKNTGTKGEDSLCSA